MLLWEFLHPVARQQDKADSEKNVPAGLMATRLPYDTRCVVITKSGKRCRGRIRKGSEFCPLHDPSVAEERKRRAATHGLRRRSRLAHLPDGYLRKLTTRAAVGNAMDRLYREVRLGVLSAEMGSVLFNILTRLMDSGLLDGGRVVDASKSRSKADRLRPRVGEMLTRAEKAAWQRAIANAPAAIVAAHSGIKPAAVTAEPRAPGVKRAPIAENPMKVALQVAS